MKHHLLQATAIIGNCNDDIPSAVTCFQVNAASRGFTIGEAFGCRFDAMINAIAQQMIERGFQLFDNFFIQRRVFPNDSNVNQFLRVFRHITHGSRKMFGNCGERQHAHI